MHIIELLNQYRSLVTYVMKAFGCANINKSIRNNIIEIIFLFMVIPGRINFLQLGRFGRRSEQCYRQTFWRGGMDWLEFNLHISAGAFFKAGGGNRVGIATAPSYISKSGKETAHVGRFWSGCSGATAPQPRPWRAVARALCPAPATRCYDDCGLSRAPQTPCSPLTKRQSSRLIYAGRALTHDTHSPPPMG